MPKVITKGDSWGVFVGTVRYWHGEAGVLGSRDSSWPPPE